VNGRHDHKGANHSGLERARRQAAPSRLTNEFGALAHAGFGKGTASAVPLREEKERALAPEGTTACYISDLIPTTAHIDITWGMGFDLYPLDTIESKKRYYAQSIPEKWLTIFTHDAKTPWAYVERDESGKMVARGV